MIGILLINLGTPSAPTEVAVRTYLNVFLSDPYVITLPKLLRDFLVQRIILPRRPKKTAQAYEQIWTPQGSPLRVNSVALQQALQTQLGDHFAVTLGMRYGDPSIESALLELQNKSCGEIIILPLFPQFARATTQSALDEVTRVVRKHCISTKLHIIPDFHAQDFYIHAVADKIKRDVDLQSEFLLLSYHGLPKRQRDSQQYKKQCEISTQLMASALSLNADQYQMAFQSRLGFTKWIEPYTDQVLIELRKKGIQKIAVVCPSFVTDCIETLEEINIRLREQWMALGGESFRFVPCVNADEEWVCRFARYLVLDNFPAP